MIPINNASLFIFFWECAMKFPHRIARARLIILFVTSAVFWIRADDAFPACQSCVNGHLHSLRFGSHAVRTCSRGRPAQHPLHSSPRAKPAPNLINSLQESAEDWTEQQIKQGRDINFDQRVQCSMRNKEWSPRDCRNISGEYLRTLLTENSNGAKSTQPRIRIRNAKIEGDLDLERETIIRALEILDSEISGKVNLKHSSAKNYISFDSSTIKGGLTAEGMHSESDIYLRQTIISASQDNPTAVNFNGARIDGKMDMTGATLHGRLVAGSLQVNGSLFMSGVKVLSAHAKSLAKRDFGKFPLPRIAVCPEATHRTGQSSCRSTILDRPMIPKYPIGQFFANLEGKSRNYLALDWPTFFSSDSNDGLMTTIQPDQISKVTDSCKRTDKRQRDQSNSESAHLVLAKISGQLAMDEAFFEDSVNADALHVGDAFFLRKAKYCGGLILTFAHVGGSLDLRGATLKNLDLSEATIDQAFMIGGARTNAIDISSNYGPVNWLGQGSEEGISLNLRNTHVGGLIEDQGAWPGQGALRLSGFTFERLGGFEGGYYDEMLNRDNKGTKWWEEWTHRDPNYSPTPYTQLASVLKAAGLQDEADDIRYYGRETQKQYLCSGSEPPLEKRVACYTQTGLGAIAGYGVGRHTRIIVIWVLLATIIGAGLLWWGVSEARKHGPIWCFFASFSQLIPVIQINKEFTDFFHDPGRKRFAAWQIFMFSFLGVVGWVLGGILIAAVGGLIQGP